jgi:transposase
MTAMAVKIPSEAPVELPRRRTKKHGDPGSQITKEQGNTWGRAKSERVRRARASLIMEMTLRGVPNTKIAEHFGISRQRVTQVKNWAEEHGVVEDVRERMRQELLPKSENVYREILDATPERLADRKTQKGYELKLKAAKHMADGLGAFRKSKEEETKVKQDMDLFEYLALRGGHEKSALEPADGQLSGGFGDPSQGGGDGEWGESDVIDVFAEFDGGDGDGGAEES